MDLKRKSNMEVRSYSGIATPKTNGRQISGYSVVFGVQSEILYDTVNNRMFKEIIDPKAITPELLKRSDVKAVLEHSAERLLARYKNGTGTLSLRIDTRGLFYYFEAPHTADGDYALEMIKRGDITGSSFKFTATPKDCTWTKQENGIWVRRVNKISGLYDVSIVSDPAYSETSVSVEGMAKRDNRWKVELELLRRKI